MTVSLASPSWFRKVLISTPGWRKHIIFHILAENILPSDRFDFVGSRSIWRETELPRSQTRYEPALL